MGTWVEEEWVYDLKWDVDLLDDHMGALNSIQITNAQDVCSGSMTLLGIYPSN
jgi:hypothetical protein